MTCSSVMVVYVTSGTASHLTAINVHLQFKNAGTATIPANEFLRESFVVASAYVVLSYVTIVTVRACDVRFAPYFSYCICMIVFG